MGVEDRILERGGIPVAIPGTKGISDPLLLETRVLEPATLTQRKGAILFTGGTTSDFHDYDSMLRALRDSGYRVGSWNFRGHGDSEGTFALESVQEDLLRVKHELFGDGPVFAIGHSIGALYSIRHARALHAEAVVTIAPYLGRSYTAPAVRVALSLASRADGHVVGQLIDSAILATPIHQDGFAHIRDPVHVHAEIARERVGDLERHDGIRVGFILPGRDAVIGTTSQHGYRRFAARLRAFAPGAEDLSYCAHHLNHCLNQERGVYAPFAKDPRDAVAVTRAVTGFLGAGRATT